MKARVQLGASTARNQARLALEAVIKGQSPCISDLETLEHFQVLIERAIAAGIVEQCEYFRIDELKDGSHKETTYNAEGMRLALDIESNPMPRPASPEQSRPVVTAEQAAKMPCPFPPDADL